MRIIEISTEGSHLCIHRGFMIVKLDGKEVGKVALDDISSVIANGFGLTYSNNLLIELSKRKVPMIICGNNHNPVSFLWVLDGHHQQAKRMDAQLDADKPLKKRLWKFIVQAKINGQISSLDYLGKDSSFLKNIVGKVRVGDLANIEAQTAKFYWKELFGKDFRRDRGAMGSNSLLNYGYMIVRSLVARYVIGAGLHPTLGIHHKNANNPMRLVDDLMEPYRAYVDMCVYKMLENGLDEVNKETKQILASVCFMNIQSNNRMVAMNFLVEDMCNSLGAVYEGLREDLILPDIMRPLDIALPSLYNNSITSTRSGGMK